MSVFPKLTWWEGFCSEDDLEGFFFFLNFEKWFLSGKLLAATAHGIGQAPGWVS